MMFNKDSIDSIGLRFDNIRKLSLKVNTIKYQITCDLLQVSPEQARDMVVTAMAPIVLGSQVKTERQIRYLEKNVYSTPNSAIDWLKSLIVEWSPDLNFGWLKPEMRSFTVNTKTEVINNYLNVCSSQDLHDRRTIEFLLTEPLGKQGKTIDLARASEWSD